MNKKRLCLSIDNNLYENLRKKAFEARVSISKYIEILLLENDKEVVANVRDKSEKKS